MPTTVTLDPDVACMVEEEARRSGKSFDQVVNEAIRQALTTAAAAAPQPFRVKARSPGRLRPGIDPTRLNQLADDLDDAAILAELKRGK